MRQRRMLGFYGVAPGLLGLVAMGEAVRWIVLVLLSACTPAVSPVIDAGDARSPCQTDEAITADRHIRNPNGTPLVLPPCGDP